MPGLLLVTIVPNYLLGGNYWVDLSLISLFNLLLSGLAYVLVVVVILFVVELVIQSLQHSSLFLNLLCNPFVDPLVQLIIPMLLCLVVSSLSLDLLLQVLQDNTVVLHILHFYIDSLLPDALGNFLDF